MPEYEQTATIMAEPDALFDYLAAVEHIPEYLPVLTEAAASGPEMAIVTADLDGGEHTAHGWFRVDGLQRRMDWGTDGDAYSGWLEVEPDDERGGSVVTVHVTMDHASDADDELIDALDNIRDIARSGAL